MECLPGGSAKPVVENVESPTQIEPARIDAPTGDLPDLVAEIAAKAEGLGRALHPQTALHLASLVGTVRISVCGEA